jgi:2-oxoglutarate ferredoxin oxidoreductase subunit beta
LSVTLGVTNASFVAQTIDWNPPHLYSTIRAAYEHKGTSFVRILQRCPHFTSHVFAAVQHDMSQVLLLTHDDGIPLEPSMQRLFPNRAAHDPHQLAAARAIADRDDVYPVGLLYRNERAARYDLQTSQGLGKSQAEKMAATEKWLSRYEI